VPGHDAVADGLLDGARAFFHARPFAPCYLFDSVWLHG
jgi:hypothetical protein